jgi:hypothetical protein
MSENAYPAPATRQSWPNLRPLPAAHARLVVEREFTQQEYAQIAYGAIPEQMEDRWFIFLEDKTLFFHRSWTGYCIFQVTLVQRNASYAIADVLVSRDTSQYSGSTDAYDQQQLLFLIDNLLLGQRHPLPIPGGVPAGIATDLYHHHIAGAGHKQPKTLEVKDLLRWLWDWLWWLVRRR